jgi:ABC-type branched-subunit amino acid transport system substrate-binding protein
MNARFRHVIIGMVLLTACSSTALPRKESIPPTLLPGRPSGGPQVVSPRSSGLPAGTPTSVVSTPAGESAVSPSTLKGTGHPVGSVRGVTGQSIKIGFWIIDLAATCASLGIQTTPACEVSDEGEMRAVNAYINAHGGIAGRKVDLVVIKSQVDRTTYSAEAEAACESFVQDHKVYAVIVPPQFARPGFAYCMAKHNTPVIEGGTWPFDGTDYGRLAGVLYQPNRPRPERWIPAYIASLRAQGFLSRGIRLGLVRFDGAAFTRMTERVLKPALKRYGIALAAEAPIDPPETASSGYGGMNAQINNAILRFNDARVDRVIFFATLGEVQFFWFSAAEAQQFHPRYGLSSMDWPSFMEAMAPAAQLRGAVGVGWSPDYDVAPERDPGGSAAAQRCKRIFTASGQEAGAGRSAKCDAEFFLKLALERASSFAPAALRRAVDGLGSSFKPAETFATYFASGRYDGPSEMRTLAFDGGCPCFRYTSGPRRLG